MDEERRKDRFEDQQRIDALAVAVNSIGDATESLVRILAMSEAIDPEIIARMETSLTAVSEARSIIAEWFPLLGKPVR